MQNACQPARSEMYGYDEIDTSDQATLVVVLAASLGTDAQREDKQWNSRCFIAQ
jgi:hypothetical protein